MMVMIQSYKHNILAESILLYKNYSSESSLIPCNQPPSKLAFQKQPLPTHSFLNSTKGEGWIALFFSSSPINWEYNLNIAFGFEKARRKIRRLRQLERLRNTKGHDGFVHRQVGVRH